MTTWTCADESKYRGYLLAAVSIEAPDLSAARRLVTDLILPGLYRLHMRKENPRRKKQIITALCDAGITAYIYADRHHRDDLSARSACLRNGSGGSDVRLVIEQDDWLVSRDRADLYRYLHQSGIAVGTALSGGPPNRSQRALLTTDRLAGREWPYMRALANFEVSGYFLSWRSSPRLAVDGLSWRRQVGYRLENLGRPALPTLGPVTHNRTRRQSAQLQ